MLCFACPNMCVCMYVCACVSCEQFCSTGLGCCVHCFGRHIYMGLCQISPHSDRWVECTYMPMLCLAFLSLSPPPLTPPPSPPPLFSSITFVVPLFHSLCLCLSLGVPVCLFFSPHPLPASRPPPLPSLSLPQPLSLSLSTCVCADLRCTDPYDACYPQIIY
jgi:hypothetical protein